MAPFLLLERCMTELGAYHSGAILSHPLERNSCSLPVPAGAIAANWNANNGASRLIPDETDGSRLSLCLRLYSVTTATDGPQDPPDKCHGFSPPRRGRCAIPLAEEVMHFGGVNRNSRLAFVIRPSTERMLENGTHWDTTTSYLSVNNREMGHKFCSIRCLTLLYTHVQKLVPYCTARFLESFIYQTEIFPGAVTKTSHATAIYNELTPWPRYPKKLHYIPIVKRYFDFKSSIKFLNYFCVKFAWTLLR